MIDSVLLFGPGKTITSGAISPGETMKIKFDVAGLNLNHEGAFKANIYQLKKVRSTDFGFYDYGIIDQKDSIFVWNNCWTKIPRSLEKPKEFRILFIRKQGATIKTIKAGSFTFLRSFENVSGHQTFVFDFDQISQSKSVSINLTTGKTFLFDLGFHDWDYWNSTEEYAFLYPDGIYLKEK
jgi:hypothetical protein